MKKEVSNKACTINPYPNLIVSYQDREGRKNIIAGNKPIVCFNQLWVYSRENGAFIMEYIFLTENITKIKIQWAGAVGKAEREEA